jgi:hypothetical protein
MATDDRSAATTAICILDLTDGTSERQFTPATASTIAMTTFTDRAAAAGSTSVHSSGE